MDPFKPNCFSNDPRPVSHPAWFKAFSDVLAALDNEPNIVLITGPAGAGKTLFLREIEGHLLRIGAAVRLLSHPATGLSDGKRDESTGLGKCQDGCDHTADVTGGARPVTLVDEADRLNILSLQALRDASAGTLVLAGVRFPEEIMDTLPAQTVRIALDLLSSVDVGAFLAQRAIQAQASSPPFSAEAITELARLTGGVPRLVTMVADAAIWLAGLEMAGKVLAAHVAEASLFRLGIEAVQEDTDFQVGPSGIGGTPSLMSPPVAIDASIKLKEDLSSEVRQINPSRHSKIFVSNKMQRDPWLRVPLVVKTASTVTIAATLTLIYWPQLVNNTLGRGPFGLADTSPPTSATHVEISVPAHEMLAAMSDGIPGAESNLSSAPRASVTFEDTSDEAQLQSSHLGAMASAPSRDAATMHADALSLEQSRTASAPATDREVADPDRTHVSGTNERQAHVEVALPTEVEAGLNREADGTGTAYRDLEIPSRSEDQSEPIFLPPGQASGPGHNPPPVVAGEVRVGAAEAPRLSEEAPIPPVTQMSLLSTRPPDAAFRSPERFPERAPLNEAGPTPKPRSIPVPRTENGVTQPLRPDARSEARVRPDQALASVEQLPSTSDRCRSITMRGQLGETLTEVDRNYLRGGCRMR